MPRKKKVKNLSPAFNKLLIGVCLTLALLVTGCANITNRGDGSNATDEAAKLPDVKVFHAGTALVDGRVVTAGGRVLGVTALGENIAKAKARAYTAVKCIRWDGAWCRKDISDKAIGG